MQFVVRLLYRAVRTGVDCEGVVMLLYRAVLTGLDCEGVGGRLSAFALVLTDFVKFDTQDLPPMLLILVTTSLMTVTRGHTGVKDACLAA